MCASQLVVLSGGEKNRRVQVGRCMRSRLSKIGKMFDGHVPSTPDTLSRQIEVDKCWCHLFSYLGLISWLLGAVLPNNGRLLFAVKLTGERRRKLLQYAEQACEPNQMKNCSHVLVLGLPAPAD